MSKHLYDTSLQWFQRHCEFDRDHQAVMLACSRAKYLWSSYSHIKKACGLTTDNLRGVLHELTSMNVLHLHQHKSQTFFALRERVENQGRDKPQ